MKTIRLSSVFSRRALDGALVLLLAVLTAKTLIAFVRPASGAGGAKPQLPPEAAPAAGVALQDLLRRNLFRPVAPAPAPAPVPVEVKPAGPPPPPPVPLSQRAAHWRLAGIIPMDGGYQAAMEDGRRGASLYVSAGDALDELKVEKVLSDRVVLAYGEETLELRL